MSNRRKISTTPLAERRVLRRRRAGHLAIHALGLIGVAVLYYIAFSLFFDTPTEHRMKRHNRILTQEYKALTMRFDSLQIILDNVVARDRNVFGMLFEAEPYDFDSDSQAQRLRMHEYILSLSNKQLGEMFFSRLDKFAVQAERMACQTDEIKRKIDGLGAALNYIPAIQPIINNDLTLLTASYGMRIQPFDKHLTTHQGVDFTVPEGARVFATADGVVAATSEKAASAGKYIIIDHQNGFRTEYRHLSKVNVAKGAHVRRGDIIGLSGNTGLSFAPHLHYEVQYKGMRVDPIHYFFMELSPDQYDMMMRIAKSGMQSFD